MYLGIFWRVDLTMPFLPLVTTADTRTELGFGASVLNVTAEMAEDIARKCEKKGIMLLLMEAHGLSSILNDSAQPATWN